MIAVGKRPRETRGGPRLDVRALVVFFALAYALSWSWAIPLAAAHLVVRRGGGWPTHYPALFGPAIAAVVVTAWIMGRPGVRDLLARMARWRVPLRWWLAALSPAAFLGLALIAMVMAGKPLPSMADFGQFSGIPAIGLVGVLLLILVGALGRGDRLARLCPAAVAAPVQPTDQFAHPRRVVVPMAPATVLRDRHLPGLRPGPICWHVLRADHRRGRPDLAV